MTTNPLLDLLEKLTKLSAILALIGYIALRSHFNYLGISAGTSLGFERYLMETWYFVQVMTQQLLLYAALVAIGTTALVVLLDAGRWALRRLRGSGAGRWAQRRLRGRRAQVASGGAAPARLVGAGVRPWLLALVLCAGLLTVYVWLCLAKGGPHVLSSYDVAIGKLHVERLVSQNEGPFRWLVASCALGSLGLWWVSRGLTPTLQPAVPAPAMTRMLEVRWDAQGMTLAAPTEPIIQTVAGVDSAPGHTTAMGTATLGQQQADERLRRMNALARQGLLCVLIALMIHVPVVFGRCVQRAHYPRVTVRKMPPDGTSLQGLLVWESATTLAVWTARDGSGEVIEVPRALVQSAEIGQVMDLLCLARRAPPRGAVSYEEKDGCVPRQP